MNNDMNFRSYEEMLDYVLSNSNEEERARIMEEDKLFEKRYWKKYIFAIGKYFSEERKEESQYFGGSARDSYLLYKVSFPNKINSTLLKSEYAKEVLFNDALRIRMKYVYIQPLLRQKLEEFQRKLDDMSSKFGLKYKEKLISNNKKRIVISDTDIPIEDFNLINDEKVDSEEKEIGILRMYLIMVLETYEAL